MGVDAMRGALTLILLCAVVGMASAGEAIVEYDADGTVRVHTTASDPPPREVVAQYPGPGGRAACCKVLRIGARQAPTQGAPVSDPLTLRAVSTFETDRLAPRQAGGPFVGAGVFGAGSHTLRQRSANELRLRVDGTSQGLLACASQEGFHVVRTHGKTTLGHLYLSFGYDVEPTCTARQTKQLSAAER